MKKTIEQMAIDYVNAHTSVEEEKIFNEMKEYCGCEEEVWCFIEEAYDYIKHY